MVAKQKKNIVPSNRWLVPGALAFAILFQKIESQRKTGQIDDREALRLARGALRFAARKAMSRIGLADRGFEDDLVQDLDLRVATMDAANRFNSSKGSAIAFLIGIANTLVRERLHRRRPPVAVSLHSIGELSDDGDPAAQIEQEDQLRHYLDKLSPGELRAVVNTFGPIAGYSARIGKRAHQRDADALPRALEKLRALGRL